MTRRCPVCGRFMRTRKNDLRRGKGLFDRRACSARYRLRRAKFGSLAGLKKEE